MRAAAAAELIAEPATLALGRAEDSVGDSSGRSRSATSDRSGAPGPARAGAATSRAGVSSFRGEPVAVSACCRARRVKVRSSSPPRAASAPPPCPACSRPLERRPAGPRPLVDRGPRSPASRLALGAVRISRRSLRPVRRSAPTVLTFVAGRIDRPAGRDLELLPLELIEVELLAARRTRSGSLARTVTCSRGAIVRPHGRGPRGGRLPPGRLALRLRATPGRRRPRAPTRPSRAPSVRDRAAVRPSVPAGCPAGAGLAGGVRSRAGPVDTRGAATPLLTRRVETCRAPGHRLPRRRLPPLRARARASSSPSAQSTTSRSTTSTSAADPVLEPRYRELIPVVRDRRRGRLHVLRPARRASRPPAPAPTHAPE